MREVLTLHRFGRYFRKLVLFSCFCGTFLLWDHRDGRKFEIKKLHHTRLKPSTWLKDGAGSCLRPKMRQEMRFEPETNLTKDPKSKAKEETYKRWLFPGPYMQVTGHMDYSNKIKEIMGD